MGFTYYKDIPQATDIISESQPDILQNFQSNYNIWNVDHHTFEDSTPVNSDGQHKQINFPVNGTLGNMAGLESGVVTAPGTADNTVSQLFFKNGSGTAPPGTTFPVSLIKAWACFTGNTGVVLGSQTVNATVSRPSLGTYVVTMPVGVVSGTGYSVFLSGGRRTTAPTTNCMVMNYTIDSATQFTINAVDPISNTAQDPVQVSFSVLQL